MLVKNLLALHLVLYILTNMLMLVLWAAHENRPDVFTISSIIGEIAAAQVIALVGYSVSFGAFAVMLWVRRRRSMLPVWSCIFGSLILPSVTIAVAIPWKISPPVHAGSGLAGAVFASLHLATARKSRLMVLATVFGGLFAVAMFVPFSKIATDAHWNFIAVLEHFGTALWAISVVQLHAGPT